MCFRNELLKDHLKSHDVSHDTPHDTDAAIPCPACPLTFDTTSALATHLLQHKKSGDGSYLPELASESSENKAADGSFSCPKCAVKLNNSTELQQHLDWHNNVRSKTKSGANMDFQCSQCKKCYETEDALFAHVEHMHGTGTSRCPICPRYFLNPQDMYDHVTKSHIPHMHGTGAARCPICPRYFLNPQDMYDHIAKSHVPFVDELYNGSPSKLKETNEEKIECPYCGLDKFSSHESLDQHIQSAHLQKDAELMCQVCGNEFSSVDMLSEHMKQQHANPLSLPGMPLEAGEMKYPCPHCPLDFASSESLRMHTEAVHSGANSIKKSPSSSSEVVFCAQCNMGCPNIYILAEHVHNVHGYRENLAAMGTTGSRTSSRCSSAGQSPEKSSKGLHVISPDGLTVHPLTESSRKETPTTPTPSSSTSVTNTTCTTCNATFPDVSTFETHMKNVHNLSAADLMETSCSQCNTTFHDVISYQAHMKSHFNPHYQQHSRPVDPSTNKYTCSECGADFSTEEQLQTHVIGHFLALATEYGCTSCLKLFSKPDELQKHLMDIHAHHLYRCSLCKEIFDSKVNIQVHFAIKHSNECKLYRCTMCTSVFRSEMEWQLHVKVQHLGISKPYCCFFCKESFTSETEMQNHISSAHKKQYQCPMCSEAFYVEYQLDKHMQTKHVTSPQEINNSPKIATPATPQIMTQIKPERDPDIIDYSMSTPKSSPKTSSQISPASQIFTNSTPLSQAPPQLAVSGVSNTSPILNQTSPTMTNGAVDMRFKCDICEAKFSDESNLAKHRIQDHSISLELSLLMQHSQFAASVNNVNVNASTSGPSILSPKSSPPTDKFSQLCVYCNQNFKTKGELEKHMKTHVSPSNQKCNICDDVFPSASILAEHKLTHCKVVKGNVCVICKVQIKNEEGFYTHSQQHGFQGTNMQCVVCRQTLASMLELQMHGRHHFQAQSVTFFTCCVCLKNFDSKENLVSKLNANGRAYYVCKPCYHGESNPELVCPTCGFRAESQVQLESHILVHKKTFQCIKCQQTFSSEYEIQLHVATHMMQEGNVHECRICNNNFESPAKLQCHLIEHTFEGSEVKCYVCNAMFVHASAIQSHVLEHGTGARRYSCSQCHQRFFFSAELQNHLYVNHKMQPSDASFQCPDCSKVFTNIINLNNHCKLHSKPTTDGGITCALCPEVFSSMLEVILHK